MGGRSDDLWRDYLLLVAYTLGFVALLVLNGVGNVPLVVFLLALCAAAGVLTFLADWGWGFGWND